MEQIFFRHAEIEGFPKSNEEKEKSMKTVLKSTKRFLAVFMALAMVVLSVPETAIPVMADAGVISIAPPVMSNATVTALTTGTVAPGTITFSAAPADNHYFGDGAVSVARTGGGSDEPTIAPTETGYSFVAVTPEDDSTAIYTVTATGSETTTSVVNGTASANNVSLAFTGTSDTEGGTWTIGSPVQVTVAPKSGADLDADITTFKVTAASSVTGAEPIEKTLDSSGQCTFTAEELKWTNATASTRTLTFTTNATATMAAVKTVPLKVTANSQVKEYKLIQVLNGVDTDITTSKAFTVKNAAAPTAGNLKVAFKMNDYYTASKVTYQGKSASTATEVSFTDGTGDLAGYSVATIDVDAITEETTIGFLTSESTYAVAFAESTDELGDVMALTITDNGVTTVSPTNAVFGKNLKFKVDSKTSDATQKASDTISNVKYFVGTAAEMAVALANLDDTTLWKTPSVSNDIYTIPASAVTGPAGTGIYVYADFDPAVGINYLTPVHATAAATNPEWIAYGEDLEFSYTYPTGYNGITVLAEMNVCQNPEDNPSSWIYDWEDISPYVEEEGRSGKTVTFSIDWDILKYAKYAKDEKNIRIKATGVTQKNVTFKNQDANIKAYPTTKATVGATYDFVLAPSDGYSIDPVLYDDASTPGSVAYDYAQVLTGDFSSLTFYGITHGKTLADDDLEFSDIYEIQVFNDSGVLKGTVTGTLNSDGDAFLTNGVLADIDIYVGTITADATYGAPTVTMVGGKTDTDYLDNGDLTDIAGLSPTHGTDLSFELEPVDSDHMINSVKYKIGSSTDENLLEKKNGKYTIPGSAITGAITLVVDAAKDSKNYVSIDVDGMHATTTNVKNIMYSVEGGDWTDWTVSATPVTQDDAIVVKTGRTMQIYVETDGSVIPTKEEINTASTGVFEATDIYQYPDLKSFTITGKVVGEDATEVTSLVLDGTPAALVSITVNDSYSALSDLQVAHYTGTDPAASDWKDYDGAIQVPSTEKVMYRYKLSDSIYQVTSALEKTQTLTSGYWYSPAIAASASIFETLTVGFSGTKYFFVDNENALGVTGWTVRTDSGKLDNNYITKYAKTASMTGVLKVSDTNFVAVNPISGRPASETIILTATLNGNYELPKTKVAIVSADGSTNDAAYASMTVVPATNGKTVTVTIKKADLIDGDCVILNAVPKTAAPIIVYTSGNPDIAITASLNGVVKTPDTNGPEAEALSDGGTNTTNQYDVSLGQKLDVVVKGGANNITGGMLLNYTTQKTTNVATKKVGDDTVLSTSVTGNEDVQVLIVLTADTYVATALAEAAEVPTSKTTVNSTTKDSETRLTYKNLETGKEYSAVVKKNGAEVVADSVALFNGSTQITNSSTGKKFNIPDAYTGKAIKVVPMKDGKAILDGAYTVTAYKLASKVTVSGISDGRDYKQEIGTFKTFNVKYDTSNVSKVELYDDGMTGEVWLEGSDSSLLVIDAQTPVSESSKKNIIIYNDLDTDSTVDEGEELFSFNYYTEASKVDGTKPTMKLASANDRDLTVTLTLPAGANGPLANPTWAAVDSWGGLVYEIVTQEEGEAAAAPVYVWTGTDYKTKTETVTLENVNTISGKANIAVTATLYVVPNGIDPADLSTTLPAAVASPVGVSNPVTDTFQTKDIAYPTTLSLKAVNNTVYAGMEYDEDSRGYYYDGTTAYIQLAQVIPDKNAAIKGGVYTVYDTKSGCSYTTDSNTIPVVFAEVDAAGAPVVGDGILEAAVVDGFLSVPMAKLNDLSNLHLDQATGAYEIKVVAPRPVGGQEVSATYKLNLTQLAVTPASYDVDNPSTYPNIYEQPDANVILTKKTGKALTANLSVGYDTYSTKANLNKFDWSLSSTASDFDGFEDYDELEKYVTVSNGKVTVDKDFMLDSATPGEVFFTVLATSENNSAVGLAYRVDLIAEDYAATLPEGELVIGLEDVKGVWVIARKGTAAMTPGEFYQKLAAFKLGADTPNANADVYLLRAGAVIDEKTSFVDKTFVIGNGNYAWSLPLMQTTSSNVKAAIYGWDEANTENAVWPTGSAASNVTFTSTASLTGNKKSVTLPLKTATLANTKTQKDYFTLDVVTTYSDATMPGTSVTKKSATNRGITNYADKKATITYSGTDCEDGIGEVVELRVLKGSVNPITGDAVVPATTWDCYSQQLKTGTGTSLIDSNPADGYYKIALYGATGVVSLNNVTYTLTNTSKTATLTTTVTQDSKTPLYSDYLGGAQSVSFQAKAPVAGATQVEIIEDKGDLTGKSADFVALLESTKVDLTGGKTFTLTLDTFGAIDPLVNGNYTFYAIFENDADTELTLPCKVTAKAAKAPVFSPKTAYTIEVSSATATPTFTLADSKGTRSDLEICEITNVLDKNGLPNAFVESLIDPAYLGGLWSGDPIQLNTGAQLLDAAAADKTGFVTFTTDGGLTTKTVKVTLNFVASAAAYADELEAAIGLAAAGWSAEDTTQAKVLNKIKGLINLPQNVTLKLNNFNYNYATRTLTGTIVVDAKKSGSIEASQDTVPLNVTIPERTVTVTTSGVSAVTYTIKDGANSRIPDVVKTGLTDGTHTVDIPNGATLSVKSIVAATGITPDMYYVKGTAAKAVESKNGAGVVGQYLAAGTARIAAENLVTITKGTNIKGTSVTYVSGRTGLAAMEAFTTGSGKIYVQSGDDNITVLTATPAAGYDPVLTETVGKTKKTPVTVDGGLSVPTSIFGALTNNDVKETRTFAVTASAHVYNVTIDGVTGDKAQIYNTIQWYNPTSRTWETITNGTGIPAAFGTTVKYQLQKSGAGAYKVGKAAGEWTPGVKEDTYPTALKTTENQTYTSFTTNKVLGDTTVTVSANKNIGITMDTSGALGSSASALKMITGGKTTAMTSKRQVVIPSGQKYQLQYTLRDGYRDDLAVSPAVTKTVTTDTKGVRTITVEAGDATTDEYFTVTTYKATEVGEVDGGTGVVIESASDIATFIDEASYTVKKKATGETETLSLPLDIYGTQIDALIGDTLTYTVKPQTGYGIQVQTFAPGATKGTNATVKKTGDVYTWTGTIADNVAKVVIVPVAERREISITNMRGTTVTDIQWSTSAAPTKFTKNLKPTSYYGDIVTVKYTVKGGGTATLSKAGDAGLDPVFVSVVDNVTSKTYTYTIQLTVDKAAYKIN